MTARYAFSVAFVLLAGTTAFGADPAGTWQLVSRTRVTVCARGRCQTQSQNGQGTLVISGDGTYTVPSDIAGCEAPDENGTWVARKRGRYLLRPSNVHELVQAIKGCLGASGLSLRGRFHEVFKPSDDGTTATGRVTFNGSGSYHGVGFTATATERYTATRIEASIRTDASGASGVGTVGVVGLVERAVP